MPRASEAVKRVGLGMCMGALLEGSGAGEKETVGQVESA